MQCYKVIDLFAGAGGLSEGFLQEGSFEIIMAVEKNKDARATYQKNHPNTQMDEDVTTLDYDKIRQNHPQIDVIIGGPPCQGFSNANRQKSTAISGNNALVKAYVKAICELSPKAFIMENVAMLRSSTHKFYYTKKDNGTLDKLGIVAKEEPLVLLPSSMKLCCACEVIHGPALRVLLAWKEPVYHVLNTLYKTGKAAVRKIHERIERNRPLLENFIISTQNTRNVPEQIAEWNALAAKELKKWLDNENESVSLDSLKTSLSNAIHVQQMLRKLNELDVNDVDVRRYDVDGGVVAYLAAYPVLEYIEKMLGNLYDIKKGVLNAAHYGAPQYRQRYIIFGVKRELSYYPEMPALIEKYANHPRTVRDAIEDLENVEPYISMEAGQTGHHIGTSYTGTELKELRNLPPSGVLYNHIATETTETAIERFKTLQPGQNFHDLSDDMKTTYSDASRTQNTIYLRLVYDKPSGTVINVRKSMWIHPTKDRALSIREAARLQTFRDTFSFIGSKNSQYQQVGNAVPPILARAIAEEVHRALDSQRSGD